jgi:hypothetical protein
MFTPTKIFLVKLFHIQSVSMTLFVLTGENRVTEVTPMIMQVMRTVKQLSSHNHVSIRLFWQVALSGAL